MGGTPVTNSLLCSDWEVRAWLDGRKREFRRPIRELAGAADSFAHQLPGRRCVPHPKLGFGAWMVRGREKPVFIRCPYAPGSRLTVKETWSYVTLAANEYPCGVPGCRRCVLRPDGSPVYLIYRTDEVGPGAACPSWASPAVMPAWASRLTLLVTACRAERVQEITVDGLIAEGLTTTLREHDAFCDLHEQFIAPWDSRYGKRPGLAWADNPWVWVTTAEVERG